MRFSVIIPCFNASHTIERALDSIAGQSFKDCEIICVDDCSKDNTVEVVQAYKDRNKEVNITLICNKENGGPGVSRNTGISKAQGDYLCFLDADDYFDSMTFSVLDKQICEADADIIFYGFKQIIGNTTRKCPMVARKDIPDYIALVTGSLCLATWKRSLWKGVEMPAISNAEDIAVIPVVISRATKVITICDTLYNYVHDNTSTSSRHHPQVSYNFVSSFHYTLQHIDLDNYRESVEFHGIKTIIYGATINALKAGMSNGEIIELWSEFEQIFPDWKENTYLSSFAKSKRLFVLFAAYHNFGAMRCYASLHKLLLKYWG